MISAVDSSVLLDILLEDAKFVRASESLLRKAQLEGKLIINECVAAELIPAFKDKNDFTDFINDLQLEFTPSTMESSMLAGKYYSSYLKRGGTAKRVLPDFLIGAHAFIHADRLLARNRGYLKDYFNNLIVIDPSIK